MQRTNTGEQLFAVLAPNLDTDILNWISSQLDSTISAQSSRKLYLTYTLLASKIHYALPVQYPGKLSAVQRFLEGHNANLLEIGRIYLLVRVLEENHGYFMPKVAQLIQLADTSELVTFLRFLMVLPYPGDYKQVAVEALRTNIGTVFDAISQENPYPHEFFNEQQWNQMYLKAAFMQRDLGKLLEVDKRANKDLARIISDYAHERWAAGRNVDPLFWRPVSGFLEGVLLQDMARLLQSEDLAEKKAGALCCYHSPQRQAKLLLENHPDLKEALGKGTVQWKNIKE